MIPLPELLSELMVGLGAALFGANLLVFVRARKAAEERKPQGVGSARPPSMRRVYVNMAIGAVIALWGLATIIRG